MSWAGRWWRAGGVLFLLALYVIGLTDSRLWVKAFVWFGGLIIFAGSWFIAAWFDINTEDTE